MNRLAVCIVLLVSLPALAQESGRKISAPLAFFEDADVTMPGVLSVSHDFSYGSVTAGHDLAFPGTYVSLGLNSRLDISGGTSYVRSQFEDFRVNGIGDTYVGMKVVLLPEEDHWFGLAVKPTLEVLGTPSVANNPLAPGRPNFLLPVMAQKSFEQFRIYGTTGYLTRGIVFGALAFELNRWTRVTPTVVLLHGRLTRNQDIISEWGFNRSRSDILAGAAVSIAPQVSIYGNVSHSFGRTDLNSIRYQISGGVSYYFRLWEP